MASIRVAEPLNTVNVLESISGIPRQIVAFPDNKTGVRQAENLFKRMARENERKVSDGDLEAALDDGYIELSGGEYSLYLIHSTAD